MDLLAAVRGSSTGCIAQANANGIVVKEASARVRSLIWLPVSFVFGKEFIQACQVFGNMQTVQRLVQQGKD